MVGNDRESNNNREASVNKNTGRMLASAGAK